MGFLFSFFLSLPGTSGFFLCGPLTSSLFFPSCSGLSLLSPSLLFHFLQNLLCARFLFTSTSLCFLTGTGLRFMASLSLFLASTGLCFLMSTSLRFLTSTGLCLLTSTGLCFLVSTGFCFLTSTVLCLPASASLRLLTSASLRFLGFFLQSMYSLGCLAGILGGALSSELSITFLSSLFRCLACGTVGRFLCTTRNLLSFLLSLLRFSAFPFVPIQVRFRLTRGPTAHADGTSTSVSVQR
ncbi:hypothetical protein EDC04DRAFT_2027232 [Pisolithus marmoratus]|nr:hypothetical protein EDC04DRAFT_2027232 [Pisolithus marmoratus]